MSTASKATKLKKRKRDCTVTVKDALAEAKKQNYKELIIIGVSNDSSVSLVLSTTTAAKAIGIIEIGKHVLINSGE